MAGVKKVVKFSRTSYEQADSADTGRIGSQCIA